MSACAACVCDAGICVFMRTRARIGVVGPRATTCVYTRAESNGVDTGCPPVPRHSVQSRATVDGYERADGLAKAGSTLEIPQVEHSYQETDAAGTTMQQVCGGAGTGTTTLKLTPSGL